MRRFFILLSVVASVIVPLVSIAPGILRGNLPELVTSGIIQLPELIVGDAGPNAENGQGLDWSLLVFWAYMGVAGLLGFRLALRLLSLRRIVKKGAIVQAQPIKMIDGKGKLPTFSFFNFLVISDFQVPLKEREQIIAHELVHINQLHSADVLFLELVSIVFWYNPVSWYFKKEQAENHEYIADQEVEHAFGKSAYQELLVKMTIDRMSYVGNYFSKIETLKRINMMNEKRKKANRLRIGISLFSMVLVMSVLACSDGLLEMASSVTMTAEIPALSQQKMDELKALHPETNFTYVEVDIKKGAAEDIDPAAGIDRNTIVFREYREADGKIGLILSPTAEFKAMAEYTRSADGVYKMTEESPMPKGGDFQGFYAFLGENIQYPDAARLAGIEGRVFVEFVVNEIGDFTELKVLKGIGSECDEEAIRVMSMAEPWTPGKMDGKPVKVRMVLPIRFKLDDSENDS